MAKRYVSSPDEAFSVFREKAIGNPSRTRSVIVYPDYAAMPSARSRDVFLSAMNEAEKAGAVRLIWGKKANAGYIEAVILANIDCLFRHLGWARPAEVLPSRAEIEMSRILPDGEAPEPWLAIARHVDDMLPAGDIPALMGELIRIRETKGTGTYAFMVAATGDFASSKILDRIPGALLRDVGIDPDQLRRHPTILLTAGARQPDAVVLVENPLAFERAWMATIDLPVAWISTHGLVATSLERSVADIACAAAAVRSGAPPSLDALLAHDNLLYWGDLDKFGLWIFHRVRQQLPGIRLSALYRPMADLLRRGGGHPYCTLVDKAGQQEWACDDPQISALIELCLRRAVDQEWVNEGNIRRECRCSYYR